MAASPGFIFGGDTGETYDSLQRRRAVVEAMLRQAQSNAPQNLGEGINALGGAIGAALANRSLRKDEAAMREKQGGLWDDIGEAMQGSTSALAYDPAGPSGASSSSGSVLALKNSAAENDNGLQPFQTALLDTIAGPESGGAYNVMYGGKTFDGFSDHPRQANLIQNSPNAGKTSSAAGRYQFLGSTWDGEAKKLGLSDFSPANQDRAAWALASDTYRKKTGNDLSVVLQSGDPDAIAGVGPALKDVWTSLPGGIEQGTTVDRFTSAYQGALGRNSGRRADASAAANAGQAVEVASLDPSIGMDSALSYDPRRAPSARQAIGNAVAAQGGASIDGQMSPEDQARYNQVVGRQPGQVDPNAVLYAGPAEYNTPELRLDTNGARVTRDSEEQASPARQAIVGASMAQGGGQPPAQPPMRLATLPAPREVGANPTPAPEAAFSPAVRQAAAGDPAFDGFSQSGPPESATRNIARIMAARGIGMPSVPGAPDGQIGQEVTDTFFPQGALERGMSAAGDPLGHFGDPNRSPVQRVAEAQMIGDARRGGDPTAILMRVLGSPFASDEQRQVATQVLQRYQSRQDLNDRRAYDASQAELERRNGWEDYQRKARFDAELKASNPDTALDRDYKRAQINGLGQKDPTTTNDIREYQFAVQQGYTGTFPEYQQTIKKAGAPTTTIGNGENTSEFVKKSDEAAAKRLGDIVEAGNAAPAFMGDIQTLADLGKTIGTGKGAQVVAALGPYAEALGFDIKTLDETQAYQGIISRLAPQMRPAGSGATSDFDARQFLSSLPSLGNTPGGNEIIQQTFQAVSENKMQAAEIAQRAQSGEIKWQDAERQIRQLPNPYERFKAIRSGLGSPASASPSAGNAPVPSAAMPSLGANWPQGGQIARPRSDAEFGALPKGALYVDPDDGKTYRK